MFFGKAKANFGYLPKDSRLCVALAREMVQRGWIGILHMEMGMWNMT